MLEARADQKTDKSPAETTVKLFHPSDSNNPCDFSGKSEQIILPTSNSATVRVLIESGMNQMFSGERCKKCGTFAKVSLHH